MRRGLAIPLALVLGLALAAVACGPGAPGAGTSAAGGKEARAADDAPAAASASVPLLDPVAIAKLLADSRGRVVVVNVWATWCLPCVNEWPELDRFARDYRNREVEVVAISVDDPTLGHSAVEAFVAARKPAFRVVQRADGPAEALARLLDPAWDELIPATFVFDRAGRLSTRLTGARHREEFEQAVAPLVGGPRPRPATP
jgi:thiol-disulfide isomerase/thioredoxin